MFKNKNYEIIYSTSSICTNRFTTTRSPCERTPFWCDAATFRVHFWHAHNRSVRLFFNGRRLSIGHRVRWLVLTAHNYGCEVLRLPCHAYRRSRWQCVCSALLHTIESKILDFLKFTRNIPVLWPKNSIVIEFLFSTNTKTRWNCTCVRDQIHGEAIEQWKLWRRKPSLLNSWRNRRRKRNLFAWFNCICSTFFSSRFVEQF